MYEVVCPCGRPVPVRGVQAGGEVDCPCGRRVAVPSLSELRRAAAAAGRPEPTPPQARHDWRLWWTGLGLLVAGESLTLLGYAAFGGGTPRFALLSVSGGSLLAIAGLFAVGLGKGYAVWFCALLMCLPFGRIMILIFPGKGTDAAP